MTEKSPVLRLAPGLDIPAEEFIESRTALIAKSGGGKSGGVKIIEEELHRVGLPFITFDPVGIHWGIRSSFDGKSEGLAVLVVGGEHGDVPLNRHAGAQTCRAILEANVSAVLDFKGESKSAYREFVKDFSNELLAHNASSRCVILEEAPELVPQRLRPDMAETFDAVEKLVRLGRNQGIGVVLVSQRTATIAKDVLTQIDTMFVGRLIGLPDRKALREWVEAYGAEERWDEFSASLATLPTRTMWLWSPEQLKRFEQIRFRDFKTLHADRTHLRRLGLVGIRPVTTDVAAITAKLGAEVQKIRDEKATAAEVPALRREVKRLEAALAAAEAKAASRPAAPSRQEQERQLNEAIQPFREEVRALRVGLKQANARLAAYAQLAREMGIESAKGPVNVAQVVATAPQSILLTRHVIPSAATALGAAAALNAAVSDLSRDQPMRLGTSGTVPSNGDAPVLKLLAGQRRMLAEIVRASNAGRRLTRAQLGILVGMSPGGGYFQNSVGGLRSAGLIESDAVGFTATPEGTAAAGDVEPMPLDAAGLRAMWEARLSAGERRILAALVEAGAEGLSRAELAERAGMTSSAGYFQNCLSRVRSSGVAVNAGDRVRAAEELIA